MLEAGWQFNVVVLLVCECLGIVQMQGSAAWALLVCGASWVHGSPVAPLALFVCKSSMQKGLYLSLLLVLLQPGCSDEPHLGMPQTAAAG